MKKILIYDVAAESGGALTVLNFFYKEYSAKTEYECFFVTSVVDYPVDEYIHLIKLPWSKKTWIHRLYCDYIYMPKMIKNLRIDEVLSLQNIGVPNCSVRQTVYVHNAIPFTEHKFSLFKDPFLWVYQNIIGHMICASLKKVDNIIVQTQWMKEAITSCCSIAEDSVYVQPIYVEQPPKNQREITEQPLFFYPTSPVSFKNIQIIIDACKIIKSKGISNYSIVLTLTGKENQLARNVAKEVSNQELPINLVGKLDKEQMNIFYKKSILLFPSYLETVGLPLLEASAFDAPIIVADCNYAHDVLRTYKKANYFNYRDTLDLANKIMKFIPPINPKS